jgi:hypothetical protein
MEAGLIKFFAAALDGRLSPHGETDCGVKACTDSGMEHAVRCYACDD